MTVTARALAKRYVIGTPLEGFARTVSGLLQRPAPLVTEDALTLAIMTSTLRDGSHCLDVGCHKGLFLGHMLRLAPQGRHYGFEPIPRLAAGLARRYAGDPRVAILPYALGERNERTTFHHNRDNPAFSGLLRRRYPAESDRVEVIDVDVRRLDDAIDPQERIDFLKVDVEGAELAVFRGGASLIDRWRPTIVFEFGTGSSEYYGCGPDSMFAFFERLGYGLWRLADRLEGRPALTRDELDDEYRSNRTYYFVAACRRG